MVALLMPDVGISAVSRSMDASLLPMSDLVAGAGRAGVDYRVIGGQMVALHVAVAGVGDRVPARDTADADAGIPIAEADTHALHDELVGMGYVKTAGDRLERDVGGLRLAVDVLLPSFRSGRRQNVRAGPFVATEAGGLGYAFGQPPFVVEVHATLTDGGVLPPFGVLVPSVVGALIVKAYAWADRREHRDAVDVWRLLVAASAVGAGSQGWPTGRTGSQGASLLRDGFGSTVADGTVAATDDPRERATIAALVRMILPLR
jgi:hypothetical protein